MSADWLGDLLVGVAEFIDANGVLTWTPDVVDPAADPPPLVIGSAPDDPPVAVGMMAYSGVDDPQLSDVVQPIQFLIRGTKSYTSLTAISSGLFTLLEGRMATTLGGVHVGVIARNSSAPLGPDQSGRLQLADNYYFTANRPTPGRQ